MDVEDLVKSYFRLGFSNKEILCLLAHQHGVIISKMTLQRLCRKQFIQKKKIRQTLRKLPLLCSLRWRPVVDSKDIDGYICVLFEEDMLFLKRLRMVIKEIDPEGVELRCARRLRRRQYFSRGPNALWHYGIFGDVECAEVQLLQYSFYFTFRYNIF